MLGTVMAFFKIGDCKHPTHGLEGAYSHALWPFWHAVEVRTPELEMRAAKWFEENGATSLQDISEFGLTEQFLDFLELKPVQRLKAYRFLATSRDAKVEQRDPRCSHRTRSCSSILRRDGSCTRPPAPAAAPRPAAGAGRRAPFSAVRAWAGEGLPGEDPAPAAAGAKRPAPGGRRTRPVAPGPAPALGPAPAPPATMRGLLAERARQKGRQRGAAYGAGQAIEVYSRSQGSWVAAFVVDVFPDGGIDIASHDGIMQKRIHADVQASLIRPMSVRSVSHRPASVHPC